VGAWVRMIKRPGEVNGDPHYTHGEDEKHKDNFTVKPLNRGVDKDDGVDQVKCARVCATGEASDGMRSRRLANKEDRGTRVTHVKINKSYFRVSKRKVMLGEVCKVISQFGSQNQWRRRSLNRDEEIL
jgi:hypothetical protein